MTVRSVRLARGGTTRPTTAAGQLEAVAVLGAVREDIRQTLRVAWIDPALEAAAAHPVFFTAAWSAIRPNVGKSFLALARKLREEAADLARTSLAPPDLRKRLEGELSEEELRRVEDTVRAAHLAAPKVQIVVHALTRAARRERLPGTGREEPPVRRGVPDWQRWMSLTPSPAGARSLVEEAARALGAPVAPTPLRLLARWPAALSVAWEELAPGLGREEWRVGWSRLRRSVLAGIGTLPHPVDLQWAALRARGFGEEDREALAVTLARYEAVMPAQTMLAAYLWAAFGAPDVGVEG